MVNKHRGIYQIIAIMVVFLSVTGNVSALGVSGSADVGVGISESKSSVRASTSAKINDNDNKSDAGNDSEDDNSLISVSATSSVKNDENSQGDKYKSNIAKIVQNLLIVANRDGGVGADVKLVAQEQASTSIKTKEDMEEINGESKIKVFLFGSNYKNLGEIRSTLVTTRNHIERLKKAEQKTTSVTTKAELAVQISALEKEASTTEAFILEHENKFSIFGWFVRMFSK